jgi:hypothetical protein
MSRPPLLHDKGTYFFPYHASLLYSNFLWFNPVLVDIQVLDVVRKVQIRELQIGQVVPRAKGCLPFPRGRWGLKLPEEVHPEFRSPPGSPLPFQDSLGSASLPCSEGDRAMATLKFPCCKCGIITHYSATTEGSSAGLAKAQDL